jgi:3-oxoadipate enol-lactonase/4-carboxymuconolactone decarboxylase
MRMRRAVLGDAHVDRAVAGTTEFTEPFQDFITRTAWGDVWSRPGLDQHTRRLLTLAVLTAVGNTHELDMHIRAALRAGLEPAELAEVFLHTAVYAGVPNSNLAFGLGKAALADGVGSRPADDTAAGPADEETHRP